MKPLKKSVILNKPVTKTTNTTAKSTLSKSSVPSTTKKAADEKKEQKHVKLDSSQVKGTHQVQPAKKKSSNTLTKSQSKEKLVASKENSKTISKENSSAKLVEKNKNEEKIVPQNEKIIENKISNEKIENKNSN
jgi:hypothetical protein